MYVLIESQLSGFPLRTTSSPSGSHSLSTRGEILLICFHSRQTTLASFAQDSSTKHWRKHQYWERSLPVGNFSDLRVFSVGECVKWQNFLGKNSPGAPNWVLVNYFFHKFLGECNYKFGKETNAKITDRENLWTLVWILPHQVTSALALAKHSHA